MNVYTIGEDIQEHWHWVQPYLSATIEGHPHGYPEQNYLDSIKDGHTLVLVIESDEGERMCVSLLTRKPNALHVTSAAGYGLEQWGSVAEQVLTEIATGMGVEFITSNARKGWAKIQTQHNGWEEREVFIVRTV